MWVNGDWERDRGKIEEEEKRKSQLYTVAHYHPQGRVRGGYPQKGPLGHRVGQSINQSIRLSMHSQTLKKKNPFFCETNVPLVHITQNK